MTRALTGLVLAAAAFPLLVAAHAALAGTGGMVESARGALLFALCTFAVTLILGVPAAGLYRQLGRARWWLAVPGGVAIGWLMAMYGYVGLRGNPRFAAPAKPGGAAPPPTQSPPAPLPE